MFFLSDDPLFSDEELLLMCAASGGKTVEAEATGNPLTFTTDLARPLKSLLIPFTPVQSGTGDPSPVNVRPIVPWNGLKVWHGGKNLFDFDEDNIRQETTSSSTTRATYHTGLYGGKYTISAYEKSQGTHANIHINIGKFKNGIATVTNSFISNSGQITETTVNFSDDEELVLILAGESVSLMVSQLEKYNIQIEFGDTASQYEAPTIAETDISFPSPVYGGTLDVVSGVLTVEWIAFNANDSDVVQWMNSSQSASSVFEGNIQQARNLDNKSNIICNRYKTEQATVRISEMNDLCIKGNNSSNTTIYIRDTNYSTLQEFIESLDGAVICYELATPQEITLTPEQITAIKGNNTIWSDADGSMTAVYLKKG